MADLRISELEQLAGANLAAADLLAVADISASESRKITVTDFIGKAVTLIADATIPNAKILFTPNTLDGAALEDDTVSGTKLSDRSIDGIKLGNNSSCQVVLSLPTVGNFVGQLALDATNSNLGYIWNGSSWVAFKAAGSVNTVIGSSAGVVNISVTQSGDEVTISTTLDDTTAASEFLAGPTSGGGAVGYRAIQGADLPTPTAAAKGGVVVNGNGLTLSGDTIAINNSVTPEATNYHVVQYDANGLVTDGRLITGADLPVATSGTAGTVLPGSGLVVDVAGVINHDNSVTAGTATKVTFDSEGHITGTTALEAADIPDLDASKVTTGQFSTELIANSAITGAKLAGASVTKIGGSGDTGGVVVFPEPDYTGQYFYDSLNGDLYLWDGNAWQPITITAGEIVFAGTYSAASNTVATTTTAGAAAGLTVGNPLPSAADTNNRYYVIVADSGTGTAPAPTVALAAPDMLLSDGTAWTHIDVSNTVVTQQADAIGITAISGITANNVQAALEDLQADKVESASPTFTGDVTLNGGDLIYDTGSFNTTVTATTATAARTITYPDATGTVLLAGGGYIVNADINSSAAISFSKLQSLSSGNLIVGSSGGVATGVPVTGDITLSSTGVTAIEPGAIINADINNSAAIAFSKLAALNSANILVGNSSNVATSVAVTGDVTISNTGVTSITSEAIVNADISPSAEIAVSKLADGAARQLLQTDAAGTGVEWTSNVSVPGTLDVTGQTTLKEIKETVYTLTGSAIDPANGSIQSRTLTGNVTFTDSLESGQTVVLMLQNGSSYTVQWPTITWVTGTGNSAPTLTAKDTLVLWKVSTTLYGAYVGSFA